MDILDKRKYIEFSHILSGCRTIIDAYFFAEIYLRSNPEMGMIIYSMINGKKYEQVLDFKSIKSALENINENKYKDDAIKCEEIYNQKTNDNIQKKTFNKIIKNKPNKPQNVISSINLEEPESCQIYITKNCPHCSIPVTCSINTKYIICGYVNNITGYDWKGCGKDWCFECGKLLCKSWDCDKLFLQMNRFHDNECCKNHAKLKNADYIFSYCQCANKNVNRDIKSML